MRVPCRSRAWTHLHQIRAHSLSQPQCTRAAFATICAMDTARHVTTMDRGTKASERMIRCMAQAVIVQFRELGGQVVDRVSADLRIPSELHGHPLANTDSLRSQCVRRCAHTQGLHAFLAVIVVLEHQQGTDAPRRPSSCVRCSARHWRLLRLRL